jgi:2-oxoglutarate dehydrogenase complex dehydrogenase (E1) component-like enzyme
VCGYGRDRGRSVYSNNCGKIGREYKDIGTDKEYEWAERMKTENRDGNWTRREKKKLSGRYTKRASFERHLRIIEQLFLH